jgi:hypothetical protein
MAIRRKSYRVIYHDGPELTPRTKASSGRATVNDEGLSIEGKAKIGITASDLTKVELYRLQGSMRMIRLEHAGGTLHIVPVRLNLLGYFVIVNFFAARKLFDELSSLVRKPLSICLIGASMLIPAAQKVLS